MRLNSGLDLDDKGGIYGREKTSLEREINSARKIT
jgi:hypothetical protein